MAFLLVTLSLFGAIGALLYLFLVFNFNYWKKRGVLGPKPRLLFGNIPNVLLQKRNFQYDIIDIYREYKGKDRFVGIFNVRNPQLLIIDPKLVQDVLITNFRNFSENELAQHESVQQKLRDEINKTMEENGEVSFENLQELPYLDQCINECLRLYPPVIASNKMCSNTCELMSSKEKPIKIEKGTPIPLPYYALHHDPEYYPNPEAFIPERFSPENGGAKKYKEMGVFLPFGDGPRICLGMKFALYQSKAAIVEVIRNWKVKLNPKTNPNFIIDTQHFLCVPEGGTWVDFERINN